MVLPFAYLSLFPLGVALSRVIFITAPPGQCLSKCWSKPSNVRRPLGNQGLCQPVVLLIRCALRTRYVQLLSGFVGTFGRLCWSCFTIVEMSCKPGFRVVSGIPGTRSIPSLIARACHGLSWDTPAGYNLSKAVPAVIGRWEFVNVRL